MTDNSDEFEKQYGISNIPFKDCLNKDLVFDEFKKTERKPDFWKYAEERMDIEKWRTNLNSNDRVVRGLMSEFNDIIDKEELSDYYTTHNN